MDIGRTKRTRRLKAGLVSKACYNGNYEEGIYVDVERARLCMEGWKANEGTEPVIRRARTLAHVLANLPIAILDDELIVGNPHADPHALPVFPEINVRLLEQAIEDGYVRKEDRETALELTDYWRGKTIASRVAENLSPWIQEIVEQASSFISMTWKDGIQHCVPDWGYTFGHGTAAIRELVKAKLDDTRQEIEFKNGIDLSAKIGAKYLYEGMLESLDALDNFIDRFAEQATQKAEAAQDKLRAKELRQMAKMLSTCLKKPPATFWEACQGFYFLHLVLSCIDSAAFGSLARVDQALWSAYERDVIKEGNISADDAQEMIECLMLKIEALGGFFSRKRRMHFEGNGALPIWTVGGINSDGTDACNELTEVILHAARSIRVNQPTISILYHPEMRDGSLVEAIKTIRSGLGYPSVTNVGWMVSSLMRQGIPVEAARNSGVVGCVSVCPVESCNTTKRLALSIIAAKSLELALNEGKCLLSGKKMGPDERPAIEFKNIEDVIEAVKRQLEFSIGMAVNVRNLARHYERLYRPNPLASALHRTPLTTGVDAVAYEDYQNNYWLNLVGVINIVNSLLVLDELVFQKKKYTMADFVEVIRTNWEGKEAMRQECINKVRKFGNDDEVADALSRRIFSICSDVAENTYDINGGYWSILAQSVSMYKSSAESTGAMPDGKLKGKPLADGGISPDHGTDREGIFSVLSSVGHVDHTRTKGLLLNQWIAPELLAGEEGIGWMKALLKMWYERNISQVQFNVVDPAILRAAQKTPEKYPNLTVRVSGYTANWIKLTPDLQEVILSRTCQTGIS